MTPRTFFLPTISILTLSMITSIDIDTRTLFRWNKMKCVLFKFKDNLFIWSQSTTLTISSFIVLIRSSGSFPDKNVFESSAKSNENNCLDTLPKSLMYNKNKSGPNIEPCGKPQIILSLPDWTLLYSTTVLFQRDNFGTIWGLAPLHHRILVFYTI